MVPAQHSNYDLKIKKRIQLVHIAKAELRISNDDYRLLLGNWKNRQTKQPCASSKEMDFHQLGELIKTMQTAGFKLRSKTPSSPASTSASSAVKKTWTPKYESSIVGLKEEICDLAKARFGDAWEIPLNNFCARFGVKRWQWLDVNHGKAVKGVLLRLNQGMKAVTPGLLPAGAGCEDAEKGNDEEVPF